MHQISLLGGPGLGIIPSWQFDPSNPYNMNQHLVMPAGVQQTTVQPLGPTTFGLSGGNLGITMVDPPLAPFVSSLGLPMFETSWWQNRKWLVLGAVGLLGLGVAAVATAVLK